VNLRSSVDALTASRSFALTSLADFLKTPTRKAESGGHGKRLTADYVGYLLQHVQVTWECYQSLRDRYALHALEETPLGKVLGKAYLKQMSIRSFREVQPDFPPHLIGVIMNTYFGGRAEVRCRREVRQVLYCDFLSMYPTVLRRAIRLGVEAVSRAMLGRLVAEIAKIIRYLDG
jgi:hypothetical protein